ncbi:MAG TPA: group III truncated hemoglobin [Verrucomicrobiae bacterium]|nr:group III truncated hemoglobin [Verrucomicrobiae bacterium]
MFDRIGGREGLAELLRHFYADVRQHRVIGPIFNAHIHDWPEHIDKVTEFWARQTGGPAVYPGGFAAAHFPLGLKPIHFVHWLELWEFNCKRHLPVDEAQEMIIKAYQVGEKLAKIMEGRGGLSLAE